MQDRALYHFANEHFLAKVYMGKRRPFSDVWRTDLRDRPAYVDQLRAEGIDIISIAAVMGSTLAVLHWRCGVDAAGVEFFLGRDKRGKVRLWLLDFADCRNVRITSQNVTTQLIDAVVENEPFWPRNINEDGFRHLWRGFRQAYLEMCGLLSEDVGVDDFGVLPQLFMNYLEDIS